MARSGRHAAREAALSIRSAAQMEQDSDEEYTPTAKRKLNLAMPSRASQSKRLKKDELLDSESSSSSSSDESGVPASRSSASSKASPSRSHPHIAASPVPSTCHLSSSFPSTPCSSPASSPSKSNTSISASVVRTLSSAVSTAPSSISTSTSTSTSCTSTSTPTSSSSSPSLNPLMHATQALSISSIPDTLLCREKERERIASFVQQHLERGRPGSMYISGKPGTGKTASVREVLGRFAATKLAVAEINCMQLTDPRAVYKKLHAILHHAECRLAADKALAAVLETLSKRKTPLLLVVDEVDQLVGARDCDVLYNIFEWPANFPLVSVIGIANALDLTERVLPLLAGRGLKPAVLSFAPYTRLQLISIIRQRLPAETGLLSDAAVQLCAAKVTATSGDVRVALDLCRRAVERSARGPTSQLMLMKTLCEDAFASADNRLSELPLHQRMLLCALCRLDAFDRETTVGLMQAEYRTLCRKVSLAPLRDELLTAVEALVCGGLLSRGKGKEARDSKVKLLLLPADVERACTDSVFEGLFPSRKNEE